MDVVGHQAVGGNVDPVAACAVLQQVQIGKSVTTPEKDVAPAISALSHMMRNKGEDRARPPWHGRQDRWRIRARLVEKPTLTASFSKR
jgi:hypothetical protein